MAITVDNLQIEIQANANNASNSIKSLTSALERLKNICKGGVGLGAVAREVSAISKTSELKASKTVKNIAKSVRSGMKSVQAEIQNASISGESLDGTANSFEGIKTSAENARMEVADLKDTFDMLNKGMITFADGNHMVREVINETASYSADIQDVFKSLSKGGINPTGYNALADLMKDAGQYSADVQDVMSALNSGATMFADEMPLGDMSEYISEISDVQQVFDALSDGSVNFRKEAGKTESALSRLSQLFKSAGESAKRSSSKFGQFLSSIKRIAMYRLIRSAMKAITSGFAEGLKNAYEFSKTINGSLAKSLDNASSASLKMKNQLGASLGALVESAMPAILRLIDGVNRLAEALTMVFSAFNGSNTYLKAKDVSKAWGEATSGIKAYNKQLQKFDELNNLSSQNGSGGSSTPDYSSMFEEANVPKEMLLTANKIKDIASEITLNIKDFFTDWSNLNEKTIVGKVIQGLNGICGGIIGWKLGGVGGAIVGTLLGIGIGGYIKKFLPFDNDGTISENELLACLSPAITGLVGGALGFSIGGIEGGLIGATLGLSIGFIIEKMRDSTSDISLTKKRLFSKMQDALTVLFSGLIGFAIGGGKGAFLAMSISSALTFGFKALKEFTGGFSENAHSLVSKLAPTLNAIFGSFILVSNKYSGLKGSLLGFTTLASIGFSLVASFFKEDGSFDKENFKHNLCSTLDTLAGAGIGFAVGGVKGAAIGATITMSLKLLLGDVSLAESVYDTLSDAIDLNNIHKEYTSADIQSGNYTKGYNNAPKYNQGIVGVSKPSGVTIIPKKYASGGIPDKGTLFYAGEQGAEFVGNMGTSSAVANTDQMSQAIESASYRGMARALAENGGSITLQVEGDPQGMFRVIQKQANNYTRRTGNQAFA